MSGLKQLKIEYLRGSTTPFALPFEKGKKLTVIYGENGSGKTTVCDAFEFLGKGKITSLEKRGLGKTSKYWPSHGKTPSDVSVSLEIGDSSCIGKFSKNDVVVIPPEARPKVEILRRSQLSELLESDPAERYGVIRPFLDVSGVESSENSLKKLLDEIKRGRETALARVQENRDAIQQFWVTADKPALDPFVWAEKESKRDTATYAEEIRALNDLRNAYQRIADYPERLKDAIDALTIAQDSAAKASTKLQACLAKVAAGSEELMEVLHSSTHYLERHPDLKHCPLCESPDKAKGLAGRVAERIKEFSELRSAKQAKQQAEGMLESAQRRSQEFQGEGLKLSQKFEQVRQSHRWGADIQLPSSPCPSDPMNFGPWLSASNQLPTLWSKAESTRQDHNRFIGTLKLALSTYSTNFQAQKELDLLLPRIERALELVSSESRVFTDGLLKGIAEEVGRLYEAVHPGEGLSKVSLALDPDKRASLEISAHFHGLDGAPPQAYFSQSHLDTLGLCIFFALAGLESRENTILILDDILASVDEPHVERLIEMIFDEASKFRHCVITTHYRPWKEKLRWGWLQNGECHFVELLPWAFGTGLKHGKSLPHIEELRGFLAETPPRHESACASAGRILEAILVFLVDLYECAVPRKKGKPTLGDLLPSVKKKLREALKIEKLVQGAGGAPAYQEHALGPILDALEKTAQARNIFGCHFNELSEHLPEQDALGFAKNVLALADHVIDIEHGWPRSKKSGRYWSNSKQTRRLHPLEQPT